MNKQDKATQVAELTEAFRSHDFIYLADASGLSANDTNNLRRQFFENGVTMKVAKNTLVALAMEASGKDFGSLRTSLKGATAILISENMKAPAVTMHKFRQKSDKPVLKGAFIDNGLFIGDDQLKALTELKSKEDLVGEVIGLLQSPARNVISALQSAGGKLAGVVKTLSER
jgi:large subunit ribosomal protein L10